MSAAEIMFVTFCLIVVAGCLLESMGGLHLSRRYRQRQAERMLAKARARRLRGKP